jgi:transitional endoplasmic reticulum ATPase
MANASLAAFAKLAKGAGVDLAVLEIEDDDELPLNGNGSGTSLKQEQVRAMVLANLRELGKLKVTDDELIYSGAKLILPAAWKGRPQEAIKFVKAWMEQQEKTFSFGRTFDYRPYDGAAAFDDAMFKVFGTRGNGKDTVTFFGSNPPELRSVPVGVGENRQVPWGQVALPTLEATFNVTFTHDPEKGILFHLSVEAKRKYRQEIEAFFDIVEEELRNKSIYRGKAIDGAEMPGFWDIYKVDVHAIVYSESVRAQIEANILAPLRYPTEFAAQGLPLKRAVLLEGPPGTGKTLAASLTAQAAVACGATFILVRPGADDFFAALKTARVMAKDGTPCVVWFEDVDTLATEADPLAVSKLLDALDSAANKGHPVLTVFTTNYPDRIPRNALRPGRIDAVIHIDRPDGPAFAQLVRQIIAVELLDAGMDLEADVWPAFAGLTPAFVVEALQRTLRFTMARNHGVPGPIAASDLVGAADSLKAQLALMEDADEGISRRPDLEHAITTVVEGTLERAIITNDNIGKVDVEFPDR